MKINFWHSMWQCFTVEQHLICSSAFTLSTLQTQAQISGASSQIVLQIDKNIKMPLFPQAYIFVDVICDFQSNGSRIKSGDMLRGWTASLVAEEVEGRKKNGINESLRWDITFFFYLISCRYVWSVWFSFLSVCRMYHSVNQAKWFHLEMWKVISWAQVSRNMSIKVSNNCQTLYIVRLKKNPQTSALKANATLKFDIQGLYSMQVFDFCKSGNFYTS